MYTFKLFSMSFLSFLKGSQGTRIFLGFYCVLGVVSCHTDPLLSMASPVDGLQTCRTLHKHMEVKILKIGLYKLSLKEQSCSQRWTSSLGFMMLLVHCL